MRTVSYTILLGHSWQFMQTPWYQQMVLGAVEATAHQIPANCSTFAQAEALLKASPASADSALGNALQQATNDYNHFRYAAAAAALNTLTSQTASPELKALHQEATQLAAWMAELAKRPTITWGSAQMSN